ncbi:MAG: cysteine-rich CWC family protein [Paludibacteraceae bacterium]|nr:cysteine-rich CWC family protein [Paludibacteraceae bacterium]
MGEEKTCPRCGKGFVCRKDAPSLCQCAGIVLSERHRAYLKQTYSDCLCASCLREIAKLTF